MSNTPNLGTIDGFEIVDITVEPHKVDPIDKQTFLIVIEFLRAGAEVIGQRYGRGKYNIVIKIKSGEVTLQSTQPFPASFNSNGLIFDYQDVRDIGLTKEFVDDYNTEIRERMTRSALEGTQ